MYTKIIIYKESENINLSAIYHNHDKYKKFIKNLRILIRKKGYTIVNYCKIHRLLKEEFQQLLQMKITFSNFVTIFKNTDNFKDLADSIEDIINYKTLDEILNEKINKINELTKLKNKLQKIITEGIKVNVETKYSDISDNLEEELIDYIIDKAKAKIENINKELRELINIK